MEHGGNPILENLHATAVALNGEAVLLRGPSGCGKSDLALRLVHQGWRLVADDRVIVTAVSGRLLSRAPDTLAGMLEVRGMGIVRLEPAEWLRTAPVALVVDLLAPETIDGIARMPDPVVETVCGVALPQLSLYSFQASAVARLHLALRRASGSDGVIQPEPTG